jgi:predicted RNA-binding protein with PIN domain
MRWLIDGMNLIGSRPDRWWQDRRGAMRDTVARLEAFARETGEDVTVVFDGRAFELGAEGGAVTVVFAPRRGRDAADDEIVRIVSDDEDPAEVRVVTSDSDLTRRVRERGAAVETAGSFRRGLDRFAPGSGGR